MRVFLIALLFFYFVHCNIFTTYQFHFDHVDQCNGLILNSFMAPFGSCLLNEVGQQPNCSIYRDCLLRATSFQTYQACLEPVFSVYAMVNPGNDTTYAVDVFSDSNCTISLQPTLYIPYGCYNDMFFDSNNTACPISQLIYQKSDASLLNSFLFLFF